MTAKATSQNEIDRKLMRVILQSSPGGFNSATALAKEIAAQKYIEFSYRRYGLTEYSTAQTIRSYVTFARHIGLLDENLTPTRNTDSIQDLESFQRWLGGKVAAYMEGSGCPLNGIKAKVIGLLTPNQPTKKPPLLPTLENLRKSIKEPPPIRYFYMSLKIASLLRPNVLTLVTRRIVFVPGAFGDLL
jgi:hypothetical protein